MSTNRQWMYNRFTRGILNQEFLDGLERFIAFASSQREWMDGEKIRCPCNKCQNRKFLDVDDLRYHLVKNGFVSCYYIWNRLRRCTKKPAYVSQLTWDNLWKLWDTPEFKYKRQKMSENRRSEVGGRGSGMSLHTAGSRSANGHARALALALGRKPTKFEVFKVMHWDKRNNKWVDQRSERVALEVETRIADDLDLSDESPLDESQRLERIDEHYVECAGTTQQSIYGVGNYGSLMSSHQREIEHAREEGRAQGRAEGRAEIQNKLDEVLARQNETDEQVRFLMQQFNNRNLG